MQMQAHGAVRLANAPRKGARPLAKSASAMTKSASAMTKGAFAMALEMAPAIGEVRQRKKRTSLFASLVRVTALRD